MIFNRVWAMPSADTLTIKPIRELVLRYLGNRATLGYRKAQLNASVDPFARNCNLCGVTNDINPNTIADYHMDARDFLQMLVEEGTSFSVCVFDPPFSPRQIKECYDGIGKKMEQLDAFRTHWKPERDLIAQLMRKQGVVISMGWNTIGMGKKRGYEPIEVLDVVHGPGHNDTLVLVEREGMHKQTDFAWEK